MNVKLIAMKKILLISPLVFLCCFMLSAQIELVSCDTINFAEQGQCQLPEVLMTNSAISDEICINDSIRWLVLVDVWSDGVFDYEYSSSLSPNDDDITSDSNNNGINDVYMSPSFSGDEVFILIKENILMSGFIHSVWWKAMDGCGNEIDCNSGFKLTDDEAPMISCEQEIEVRVSDFNPDFYLNPEDILINVSDNCTLIDDLTYSYFDDPENLILDFGLFGGKDTSVTVFVFDEKGNSSNCDINIDFIKDPFPFSSYVENVNDIPIAGVNVFVNPNFWGGLQITDENGRFVALVSQDFDYSIQAEFDDGLSGISTRDIILIKEYLDDNNSLSSPFDIIACDVDNDFDVDHDDIDYLREILLDIRIDTSLWKFLYGRIEFDDESNPFPYDEGIEHIAESEWQWKELVGVKLGDVDHSALEVLDASDTIELVVENIVLNTGDDYVLDFFLPEGLDVRGFQLAMEHSMAFGDFESDQITITDENQNGKPLERSISWSDGVTVSDQPIISVNINGRKKGELADQLFLADGLQAEIYVGEDLEIHPLKLNVKGEIKYTTGNLNVTPNPFQESTEISFELEEDGKVKMAIYDLSGRLVMESKLLEFSKGRNAFLVTNFDVVGQQSGMYVLKLLLTTDSINSSAEKLTKKIFFLGVN